MAKKYDSLGVMIDMSRNGVMNLPSLKAFLTTVKKMGYNTLFLYMEDTYEVEGEPYLGYMRSGYSIEEMKEIDEFCTSIGIEAIPCIQTLAHMKRFFKWETAAVDCDDILLAGDERTYTLIENMFKTLSRCFKSRRIHIGMDEAHLLGKGRYFHEHGFVPSSTIIREHLDKICEIAKPYGYDLLLWSDMFIRIWNKGQYYLDEVKTVPKDVIESLPDGVKPVFWDYYHTDEGIYDAMLKIHKQFGEDVWFAGGIWSWYGFAPFNGYSIESMTAAMRACRKNKIKNIMMTLWGDDGMECSVFSLLPSLLYVAEYAKGNYDEQKIKAKFKRIVGVDYDSFIKGDLPNVLTDTAVGTPSPSKYLLYSDPFLGFLDYTVSEGIGAKYASHRNELATVAKSTRKYGYIFDSLAALCDVLEIKAELGVRTRKAYKAGDRAELLRLANEDYPTLVKRINRFHKTVERRWYKENKPSGMEVQDCRIAGLAGRVDACRRRLLSYLGGSVDKIEELERDILKFYLPYAPAGEGEPIKYPCYGRIVTANEFTHYMD